MWLGAGSGGWEAGGLTLLHVDEEDVELSLSSGNIDKEKRLVCIPRKCGVWLWCEAVCTC